MSTDLTNYFESIDIARLYSDFTNLIVELNIDGLEKIRVRRAIDVLFECLKVWSYSGDRGLPQNRDASSFLANMYMNDIDREMLGRGYEYFRYMDDIKIICADKYEARKALMDLTISLRSKGLSLNSKKTDILDSLESIDEELSVNRKIERIDALWRTKNKHAILRSIQSIVDFSLDLAREGRTQDRGFRFCINRIEKLCRCDDISVNSEDIGELTDAVIKALDDEPVSTDQLIKYLKVVDLSVSQADRIVEYMCDPKKAIYSWQNYLLWQLFTLKNIYDDRLLRCANRVISKATSCEADRAGSYLYLGAMGTKKDRQMMAEKFSACESFFQQRVALIGLHELHFDHGIKQNVGPHLFDELVGVYKTLPN